MAVLLARQTAQLSLPESKEDNAARGAATVLKTDVYPCTLMLHSHYKAFLQKFQYLLVIFFDKLLKNLECSSSANRKKRKTGSLFVKSVDTGFWNCKTLPS